MAKEQNRNAPVVTELVVGSAPNTDSCAECRSVHAWHLGADWELAEDDQLALQSFVNIHGK